MTHKYTPKSGTLIFVCIQNHSSLLGGIHCHWIRYSENINVKEMCNWSTESSSPILSRWIYGKFHIYRRKTIMIIYWFECDRELRKYDRIPTNYLASTIKYALTKALQICIFCMATTETAKFIFLQVWVEVRKVGKTIAVAKLIVKY